MKRVVIVAAGTSHHAALGRQVRHRAVGPRERRRRHLQRVPLPRPDRRDRHARDRRLPERRDHRHHPGDPRGEAPRRAGRGRLQHRGLVARARVRRRHLHPRRPRGLGRLDEGLRRPGGGARAAGAASRPAARDPGRPATSTRSSRGSTRVREPGRDGARAARRRRRRRQAAARRARLLLHRSPRRASRRRSRERSSSRSSPTSTPRATRRAS